MDITLPRGLFLIDQDDRGKRKGHSVTVQVQYREVGETTWLSPTLTATTGPSANSNGSIVIGASVNQPIRHGFRWSVNPRAQYDVRVRRVSADETDDFHFSGTVWSALRTFTNRAPIDFPVPLAMSEIEIRATGQLTGGLDPISGIVEAEAEEWDSTLNTWGTAYTRNPASAFRLALQSPARRNVAADDDIDLDALADFAEFCDDNGYKFDHTHDVTKGLWEVLSDICGVARASPDFVDGKWTVIVDDGAQLVRQHFTPINASNFEMKRIFETLPHALRLTFKNEDKDFLTDELIVYADNYGEGTATVIPALDPIGIVDSDHVWKWGRFHLAQTELRREAWSFEAGDEHLVIRRGSRFTCQHDVLSVGLAAARVKSTTLDSNGDITEIEIDTPIHFPKDGVGYSANVRTVDDDQILVALDNTGGEDTDPQTTLELSSPLDGEIEADALLSVGETGSVTIDALCVGITPGPDFTASVVAVPYQEGVYDAETGTIPPFDSKITTGIPTLPALVIEDVVSDRAAIRRLGLGVETAALVSVRPIANTDAEIETEIRLSGTTDPYRPALLRHRSRESVVIVDVEDGVEYDIRARWTDIFEGRRRVGAWDEETDHEIGEIDQPALLFEEVFAATDTDSIDSSKRPDNDWTFGETGTVDGLEWHARGRRAAVVEQSLSVARAAGCDGVRAGRGCGRCGLGHAGADRALGR